jgi:NAD(P)-dependent dehydrogenase (short-subunit alcohol dehydrogenase family)
VSQTRKDTVNNDRKIAVISGASSGIGLAIAKQLAQKGTSIFAGARKDGDIANLTALENVQGVRLDITHPEEIESLARRVETTTGCIDVLINNAGVPGWGAVMDRELAYFRQIMEVNLFGHVQMVKTFFPLLRKSESSPIIINISSQAGNYALPFWSPYHMSKWALEAFSDCLRRELMPVGIRVAVIQPGAFKSAAFQSQQHHLGKYKAQPASEFQSRAIALLEMAFDTAVRQDKDPQLVVNDVLHAIYSKNNKLYYQPGRRLVPDLLAAKMPQKWVDRFLMRVIKKKR